ncbi:MAG: hypothetical protein NVS9B11_08630 [Candidatus Dormibacteraceae bacterium]
MRLLPPNRAAATVMRFKDTAALGLIALVTILAGVLNHAFTGFPKGYDAYGHMSKIRLFVDYFPNIDWNHEWYGGMLYSQGSFPPLFHNIGGFLVGVVGVPTATALVVVSAASFVLIAWGLYGMVRAATGDHLAALVAALVLISSAAYWTYIVEGGLYPRILGMAFLSLFAFFTTLYQQRRGRFVYAAMVLSLAATLSSHILLGAFAVAFAITIIAALPKPIEHRLREGFKLFVPAALVVAYFYLPYAFFLQRPPSVPLFTHAYQQLSLSALFIPGTPGAQLESLPFYFLPAAIVTAVAGIAMRRTHPNPLPQRLQVVLGIAAAASLAYAFLGVPILSFFIYSFPPGQALFFTSWFIAAFIGLALSALRLPRFVGAGLVAVLLALVVVTAPDVARGEINGANPIKRQLQAALKTDPKERQFRIGVAWDGASDWINSRSDVPQTRGYQAQGVLNPDWQYYLEHGVWNARPNYAEKAFLLDWYGVKSMYGGPDPQVVAGFEARPDLFAATSPELPPSTRTFEYLLATPIMSARSTRTALVVGNNAAYALIVRALALSGFDSRSLIPVRGGEYLDSHSAADLAQFDQIILYGYKVHDRPGALAVLANYVQQGGSLVVEANNSPFEEIDSVNEPIPGSQVKKIGVGPAWNFDSKPSPITAGLDLSAFAPASYQGGAWNVSFIPEPLVRSWASPVLLSNGRPVLIAGQLGRGRVVWSGLNLPYHIVSSQTVEESRLLSQAIAWASPSQVAEPSYDATFVNPQLRRMTIASPAKGVLFKESWFGNWHASVNGTPAHVFEAGPGFMYIPVGNKVAYPVDVTLEFDRSGVEWFSDGISILAVIGLLAYAFGGFRKWRRPRRGDVSSP